MSAKSKSKFYAAQSVLCRNTHREFWKLDFFVAENEGFDFPYICAIKRWKQCIPLHGNEKYLRTSNCHKAFPKKANAKLSLYDETNYIHNTNAGVIFSPNTNTSMDVTFSGTMQIKSK